MKQADLDWDGLFQSLSKASLQVALVVAGGGSGAVSRCFRRAGASLIFVEAVIPYSRLSMANYLNVEPRGSSASAERAHQLASTALTRADALTDRESTLETAGLALVAALPSIVPRQGSDRIHVALHTPLKHMLWSIELPQSAFDRQSAEVVAEEMIYLALSQLRPDLDPEAPQRSTQYTLACGLTLDRQDC